MGQKEQKPTLDEQLAGLDWVQVFRDSAQKLRETGNQDNARLHDAAADHIAGLEQECRQWRLRDRIERASMN